MDFEVNVPDSVTEKLPNFGLSNDAIVSIMECVGAYLRETPAKQFSKRIVAPVRMSVAHTVCELLQDTFCITMWVNDTKAKGVRYLLDINIRRIDV